MDKNWKQDFKNKMQDYQEIAPEGLWDGISDAMGIEPAVKKPFIPVFLKYAGTVASAAVIALGVVFYWNRKEIGDSEINIVPSEDVEYAYIPDYIPQSTQNSQNKDISISSDIFVPTNNNNVKNDDLEAKYDTSEDSNVVDKNDSIQHIWTDNNNSEITIFPDIPFDEPENPKRKHRKIQIGATIAGSAGTISSQPGYTTTVSGAGLTSFGASPKNDIRMFNRNKDVSSATKFLQPVNVGISLKAYLSKRWSIETGIEWTWLHSSLKEGSESYYTSTTRDMHYIGIPLNLNYDIWQGRNLNVYAFAGGTLEKCVYGRNSTEYVFNYASTTESDSFSEKQLQWSVSAGAGIEYQFSKSTGIYACPGVSWHFDNGSNIENIYKARHLNFSLTLGFRFYL